LGDVDAVGAGVGRRAGRDDGEADDSMGECLANPEEVAQVVLADGGGEFGFDGEDAVGVVE